MMRKQQSQPSLCDKLARQTSEAVGSPFASITAITTIAI